MVDAIKLLSLEVLVEICQEDYHDEYLGALAEIFHTMAKHLLKTVPKVQWPGVKRRCLAKQCVCVAMERVPNFSPKKGKVFNYFVTVMLNFLRQEYRRLKKMQDLEEKYGRLL